jgi:hypothetical protein
MAWITLTAADVQGTLTAPELSAARTAAIAVGQVDPLTDALARTVAEVRGYVGGAQRNTLGEAGTIPDELKSAALDLVRYRVLTRLPLQGSSALIDQRKAAAEAAERLLREVAAGRFAIEQPATAGDVNTGSGTAEVVQSRTRVASGDKLRGLL